MTARRTNPNPVHIPAHDGPRKPGVDMPPTWSHLCSLCSARLTAGLFTRRLGPIMCRDREACAARRRGGRS